MESGYLSKAPYVPPTFEVAHREKHFVGEIGERSYTRLLDRLAALDNVTVSSIAYESDGLRVTGLEVLPHFAPDEKAPLIIYNRGGNRNFGQLSVPQVLSLMAPMAVTLRAGVLASNYRGNGGGEGREEFGGADVHDVLRLIEIGRQQPWWDGKNIFMLGWSRGGMMTYLALKAGAIVNAAAVGAGITDLFQSLAERPDMEPQVYAPLMPEYAAHKEALLTERSAVCWPQKISAPLLMLHGDADKRVSIAHARTLHDKLAALGKEVKLVEFAGGGHGLMSENEKVMREVTGWFTAYRC